LHTPALYPLQMFARFGCNLVKKRDMSRRIRIYRFLPVSTSTSHTFALPLFTHTHKMKSMSTKFKSVIIVRDTTKAKRYECREFFDVTRQHTQNELGTAV